MGENSKSYKHHMHLEEAGSFHAGEFFWECLLHGSRSLPSFLQACRTFAFPFQSMAPTHTVTRETRSLSQHPQDGETVGVSVLQQLEVLAINSPWSQGA